MFEYVLSDELLHILPDQIKIKNSSSEFHLNWCDLVGTTTPRTIQNSNEILLLRGGDLKNGVIVLRLCTQINYILPHDALRIVNTKNAFFE